jgi:hypothetical protein
MMSPIFGKRSDDADTDVAIHPAGSTYRSEAGGDASQPDEKHFPRLIELGAALDDAVKEAAATPLPTLAAKLMNELFGSDYQPRGNGVDVDSIAGPLIPPNSGSKYGDPTPPGVSILWDIAAEAVQLLQQAQLIVPDLWYSGQVACFGYRSTRAGRTAVEQKTVAQLVTTAHG